MSYSRHQVRRTINAAWLAACILVTLFAPPSYSHEIDWYEAQKYFYGIIDAVDCARSGVKRQKCTELVANVSSMFPADMLQFEHWARNWRNDALAVKAFEYLKKGQAQGPSSRVVTDTYLLYNIYFSIQARNEFQYAQAVPDELFLNDVLPYASVNEEVEGFRAFFFRSLTKIFSLKSAQRTQVIAVVNQYLWSLFGIKFVPGQTPAIMTTSDVLSKCQASCTGLSIFMVNALRSVGIPARIAGVNQWRQRDTNDEDDPSNNHSWVEVWDGGVWSFTGPTEYTQEGLNVTWFVPEPVGSQVVGSEQFGVWATSWLQQETIIENGTSRPAYFPMAWSVGDTSVPGVDRTLYYKEASARVVEQVTT